jgi:hypothetical protein
MVNMSRGPLLKTPSHPAASRSSAR